MRIRRGAACAPMSGLFFSLVDVDRAAYASLET
jgi:hypothetical protein